MKDKAKNIVEHATTLFMQNGLHSVSMDEIASRSGISKKTLYENFQSKEVMVKTIVAKLISKNSKYLRLNPEISPNAVKEIENFSEHILAVLAILTPNFIRDLKKYYPETFTRLVDFKDHSIIPYLKRSLQRGISEEIFRPDIDTRTAAWLYCWQLQNALEGDTPSSDVNKVFENVNDLFLHGMLNSKGMKLLTIKKQHENNRLTKKPGTG